MKKNNKGFTLIELLAVIVILAIIALIATPIVMGVIDDAKKSAGARSVENYLSQVELGYAQVMLNTSITTDSARITAAKDYADTNSKGDTVTCNITMDDKGSVTSAICNVSGVTNSSYTFGNGTGAATTARTSVTSSITISVPAS